MEEILKNRKVENGIIIPIEVKFDEENKIIRVTDDYIDINYKSIETPSRVLSNLFPYKFNYYNYIVSSTESVLQSLKYKDKKAKISCYDYFGVDAWHLRGINPFDWQKDGILYTPYGLVDRYNEEYQDFLDELYYLAFQNPIFRSNLEKTESKKLDHTIGEDDTHQTILTRTEYISRIYALRYCAINKVYEQDEVLNIFKKVREELKQGD